MTDDSTQPDSTQRDNTQRDNTQRDSTEAPIGPEGPDAPGGAPPSRLRALWSRITPAEHPIPWLAASGAVLVLVAAITSTTATWADVPIPARLGGVLLIHAAIVACAERWRRALPSTSRIAAHLGAALFVPTVISVVATMHGSWRSCTAIAGVIGVIALEVQARRWHASVMRAAQVAAVCAAAAGVAAITHSPIGALIAAASLGALTLRWERRAAALAALAVAAPFLAVPARYRIGPGTIAELGATGAILRWGAPIAGAAAALVYLVLAKRHPARRVALLAAAAASVGVSTAVAITFVDVPAVAWACLPGLLLVAAQLTLRSALVDDGDRPLAGRALEITELFAAFGLAGAVSTQHPALPMLVLAAGWGLGALRTDRELFPASVPGIAAVVTAGVALSVQTWSVWPSVWTVFAAFASYAALRRDRFLGMIAAAAFAPIAAGQLSALHVHQTTTSALLLAAGVAALGCSAVLRRGVTPLDSFAVTSLLVGAAAIPSTMSSQAALFAAGTAIAALGFTHRHHMMTLIGGVSAVIGGLGLFEHAPMTYQHRLDVFAASIVAACAATEWWTRRRSPWAGPVFMLPSAIGAGYLLLSLAADHTSTRLATVFVIGVVATALGAIRRLASVAVAGTLLAAGSILIATREELSNLPTWAWMLAGGFALLGLAVGMERRKAARTS